MKISFFFFLCDSSSSEREKNVPVTELHVIACTTEKNVFWHKHNQEAHGRRRWMKPRRISHPHRLKCSATKFRVEESRRRVLWESCWRGRLKGSSWMLSERTRCWSETHWLCFIKNIFSDQLFHFVFMDVLSWKFSAFTLTFHSQISWRPSPIALPSAHPQPAREFRQNFAIFEIKIFYFARTHAQPSIFYIARTNTDKAGEIFLAQEFFAHFWDSRNAGAGGCWMLGGCGLIDWSLGKLGKFVSEKSTENRRRIDKSWKAWRGSCGQAEAASSVHPNI